ncbi:MAG: histone deacetylase family protein [Lysobacterales bacterium]
MILTHTACLEHAPGPGHPESPARLAAVLDALGAPEFSRLQRRQAPRATRAQLERVHDPAMIDAIFAATPSDTTVRLDADTVLSPGSIEAALRAAGAVVAAVDSVFTPATPDTRAFCAVRPPGHHATPQLPMGFCLFNSIAVGAVHALERADVKRVAIIDFDVHHGNGTQDIFASDPRVLYVSSHQSPLYPGTGAATEHGVGNIVNLPLPPGSGGREFAHAWSSVGLPALEAHRPDLLLISAGFDAHRLDPLANLNLDAGDFAWLTVELVALAERHCAGRIVSALEGGYSLTALRQCTHAHLSALFSR